MDEDKVTLEDLDRASEAFHALVAGVSPEQLKAPTPCSEWDVRLLVNHVVTGTQWFTTLVLAEEAPDRSIDVLGDDPAAAFASAYDAFRTALGRRGALEESYEFRTGPVSGERLAQMRTNEYMVHGWDVARATGQEADLPEDLVPKCIALYEEILAGRPREAGGAFGVPISVGTAAPQPDRLAAFFGRDPS